MVFKPGQSGNPAGRRVERPFRDAINRALNRKAGTQVIDDIVQKFVDLATTGDLTAIRELADRLDGKPVQAHDVDLRTDPLIIKR